MKSAATLAFLCLLSAGPAGAATWTVDPTRSSLGFEGVQTGSPFQGKFDKFTAQIEFDPSKPEALYQFERSLLDDHRIIPLVHLRETYGIAPRVHFQPSASDPFTLHLESAWIKP